MGLGLNPKYPKKVVFNPKLKTFHFGFDKDTPHVVNLEFDRNAGDGFLAIGCAESQHGFNGHVGVDFAANRAANDGGIGAQADIKGLVSHFTVQALSLDRACAQNESGGGDQRGDLFHERVCVTNNDDVRPTRWT